MIFNEIKKERQRQIDKFGVQSRSLVEWCVILGEEVGEVNRAALEFHFKNEYPKIYTKSKEQMLSNFRKELIQIAAVCIEIIEDIDNETTRNDIQRAHLKRRN